MMTTIVVIGILLLISLVGLFKLLLNRNRIYQSYSFVREYLRKFYEFSTSQDFDDENYVWLTKNVYSIQAELGDFGVASYKPAFENYYIRNYQIFLNILPEIRRARTSSSVFSSGLESTALRENVMICAEALTRYSGVLENRGETITRSLRNPLVWFREGIGVILLFPIFILEWFGILSISVTNRIAYSFIFRIISGIFALIGFLSAIMSIVLGWHEFLERVLSLWQKFV